MQTNGNINWQSHISAQKASNLPQQSYCKVKGLNFNSFSYQIQKQKGVGKRFEKLNSKQSSFLPIHIKPEVHSSIHSYEVTFPTGESLKISKGFDISEVKELVEIINS